MENNDCGNSNDEKPSTSEIDIEFDADAEWLSSQNDLKVEPPEIPSFTDNLRISDISPEIEKRLAMNLDLSPIGTLLKNWEWLASLLGMSLDEIKYLQQRAQYPNSPTSEVLFRYRGENLGRILRLIRDELNRYDVIVDLLPILIAFEERMKLEKNFAAKENKSDFKKPDRQDSGVQLTSKSSFVDAPSTSGVEGAGASALFNLRVSSSSSFQNFAVNTKRENEPTNGTQNYKSFILITYYNESNEHLKKINWLCKNLKSLDVNVITSEQIVRDAASDLASGFLSSFQKADYIIVVCSPGYRRCVESLVDDNDGVRNVHEQYIIFLYKLMFAEYKELNCKNRRFRPIIFDGASEADVPSFLKNTLIHRWPEQHKSLMELLFDG